MIAHDHHRRTLALVGDRSPTVRAHGRIPLAHRRAPPPRRARARPVLDPVDRGRRPRRASTASGSCPAARTATARRSSTPSAPRASTASRSSARAAASSTRSSTSPASWPSITDARPRRVRRRTTQGEPDVIVPLECSLVGHEGVIRYTPGTLIASIAGVDQRLERYHCSYGIAPEFVDALEQAGVVFGAHDEDGAPRALELADHAVLPRHALPARAGGRRQPRAPGHPRVRGGGRQPPRAWKKYSGSAARVTRDGELRLQPARGEVVERHDAHDRAARHHDEPPHAVAHHALGRLLDVHVRLRPDHRRGRVLGRAVRSRAAPAATTDSAMSRSVMKPTGRRSLVDEHDRADVVLAHQRGDLVHRSLRIRGHRGLRHDLTDQHRGRVYPCATVAYRSAAQVRNKHRVEVLIRLAAPALDLVLYAGDKASRVVGRNQIGP